MQSTRSQEYQHTTINNNSRSVNIEGFENLSISESEAQLPMVTQSYEQGKSKGSLNTDRVQMGSNNREVEKFLAELHIQTHGHVSLNNSNMMIEVTDVEARE